MTQHRASLFPLEAKATSRAIPFLAKKHTRNHMKLPCVVLNSAIRQEWGGLELWNGGRRLLDQPDCLPPMFLAAPRARRKGSLLSPGARMYPKGVETGRGSSWQGREKAVHFVGRSS